MAPAIQSVNAPLVAGQQYVLKALVLENNACPIEDWLNSIKDMATEQRVQLRLDRVERGNLGDCKPVGQGIFELRMDFGAGYRIYYAVVGTTLSWEQRSLFCLSGATKAHRTKTS